MHGHKILIRWSYSLFAHVSRSYADVVAGLGLGLDDEGLAVVEVVLKELLVVLEEISEVLELHIFPLLGK